MVGLLDPVKDLVSSLTGLALVGSLFKPIPPLIGTLQGTVNGLGLLPFGLQLAARPSTMDPTLCAIQYNATALPEVVFDPFNATLAGVYRYRQQQSVNLGGWFVSEAWMTPSLFACAANNRTAEIDLASGFGSVDVARQALEQHWDTFIDPETDFAYLVSLGINTLRLPIGAWSLGPAFLNGTAFEPVASVYNNSWTRVKRTIAAASAHGLGVIVDLHGATASQNGLPHSGFSDGKQALFSDPVQVAATQAALVYLAKELAPVSNVVGIELLNEPADVPELETFYDSTATLMRAAAPEAATLPLYLSDAFNLTRMAPFVANRTDFVVLDHHAYYVYDPAASSASANSPEVKTVAEPDTSTTSQAAMDSLEAATETTHRNLIVGEFSCALSNSSLADQPEPLDARRRYCQAQVDLYANMTAGWSFWSYKLESCEPGWCFRSAVGTALPSRFSLWSDAAEGQDRSRVEAILSQIQALTQKPDADILADASSEDSAAPSSSASASALPAATASSEAPAASASDVPAASVEKRHRGMHHSRYSSRYRGRVHPRDFMLMERDPTMTPDEEAIVKAYGEGFSTAKLFAGTNGSKLGFVTQWINDAVDGLLASDSLNEDLAGLYADWFKRGIEDAEEALRALIADNGASQQA